uniref:Uncharacterized protein n=1 Tax=Timema bartmani TaxID=61472 RepID=A0A7R9F140_9NEOP|nr:unnamed protein product [Timema bartmani]
MHQDALPQQVVVEPLKDRWSCATPGTGRRCSSFADIDPPSHVPLPRYNISTAPHHQCSLHRLSLFKQTGCPFRSQQKTTTLLVTLTYTLVSSGNQGEWCTHFWNSTTSEPKRRCSPTLLVTLAYTLLRHGKWELQSPLNPWRWHILSRYIGNQVGGGLSQDIISLRIVEVGGVELGRWWRRGLTATTSPLWKLYTAKSCYTNISNQVKPIAGEDCDIIHFCLNTSSKQTGLAGFTVIILVLTCLITNLATTAVERGCVCTLPLSLAMAQIFDTVWDVEGGVPDTRNVEYAKRKSEEKKELDAQYDETSKSNTKCPSTQIHVSTIERLKKQEMQREKDYDLPVERSRKIISLCVVNIYINSNNKMERKTFAVKIEPEEDLDYHLHYEENFEIKSEVDFPIKLEESLKGEVHDNEEPDCCPGPITVPPTKKELNDYQEPECYVSPKTFPPIKEELHEESDASYYVDKSVKTEIKVYDPSLELMVCTPFFHTPENKAQRAGKQSSSIRGKFRLAYSLIKSVWTSAVGIS